MSQLRTEAIRVNQAGEYGAQQIYRGQMFILGKTPELMHMASQEAEHLDAFTCLAIQHKVRPTLLQPLWYVGGFALGAVSALFGEKGAHACTIAVESVIDAHYQKQLELLPNESNEDKELRQVIHQCHLEELEHKKMAEEKGGQDFPSFFGSVVSFISKTAIKLSEKI